MINNIINGWANTIQGGNARQIDLSPSTELAWTVKTIGNMYGVAIPYFGEDEIDESFSEVQLCSGTFLVDGAETRVLMLLTEAEAIQQVFASLCAEFVIPGENNENRMQVSHAPLEWWRSWKDMLGNKTVDDMVYDTIGELLVYRQLLAAGLDPNWNGPSGACYDIETASGFYEVKSSIVRDKKEITISNQFQLQSEGMNLSLVLIQFEPTNENGVSINSVVEDISRMGYSVTAINEKLASKGFGRNKSSRKLRFLPLQGFLYTVDDAFPRITPASFAGGVLPEGISKFTYTVDLNSVESQNFNLSWNVNNV